MKIFQSLVLILFAAASTALPVYAALKRREWKTIIVQAALLGISAVLGVSILWHTAIPTIAAMLIKSTNWLYSR